MIAFGISEFRRIQRFDGLPEQGETMLIACRAWSRFNIGERLAAHIAAGGCGCKIPCDGRKQSERVLPRKIAVGVTGNHIIDAFVPYRRARGRIMTSVIDGLRGLTVRT